MTYYNGVPVTDSLIDLWNAVGGLSVAQDIAIAAHETNSHSFMAEQARERAGYGGLDRHTLSEAGLCRA